MICPLVVLFAGALFVLLNQLSNARCSSET